MKISKLYSYRFSPLLCVLVFLNLTGAAYANPGNERVKRVIEHWTAERMAAAIPRDLVLDRSGKAYLKLPNNRLQPYGHSSGLESKGKPVGGDSTPPSISAMTPADGAVIGGEQLFGAVVSDESGIKGVTFTVQNINNGVPQKFSPSETSPDNWEISLRGFSDGNWQWMVSAKDRASGGGNSASSDWVNFSVDTGAGGGSPGDGTDPGSGEDVVTNGHWDFKDGLQKAVGRIYFEMPANKRGNRWNGYVCSGTVVDSQNTDYNLVITAAHCLYDDVNKAFARNAIFIPNQNDTTGSGTDLNCSNDPLGCWAMEFGVVDKEWTNKTFPDNIRWDYGFYGVAKSGSHSGTTDTSDELGLAAGTISVNFDTYTEAFDHALGYSYSEDPLLRYCAEQVTTETSYGDWWMSQCGMSGGSSGGPWVENVTRLETTVDSSTAKIFSVNSWGYTTQPGMAGPKLDGSSAAALADAALRCSPGNDRGVIVTDTRCD